MKEPGQEKARLSRRGFIARACGLAAAAGAVPSVRAATNALAAVKGESIPPQAAIQSLTTPFWGPHQAGILTPQQNHTYFAAFDLVTTKRDDLIKILRDWTAAAARMTTGLTAEPQEDTSSVPGSDTGEALGLTPAKLTLTFGFGPGLFSKDGLDRYGLAKLRPAALVDLPPFNGDQLAEARTGGDISVQACANDPQVAFHAIRQLARLAAGNAHVRWVQTGFYSKFATRSFPYDTPRNLMGFKDGTTNPAVNDPREMDKFVWVGNAGPAWMQGGSYVVVRRIRMALKHWDQLTVASQEETIGRHKYSGAPLGGTNEFDPPDLEAKNKGGNLVVPENSHVRLAVAARKDGSRILRRSYSYNDGTELTAEQHPRSQPGPEYDAGLLFICYQLDPRAGFIKIFDQMAQHDRLMPFVTHTGGGLFACPGGAPEGEFIGQRLFAPA